MRYTNSSGQTIIGQGKRAAGLSDPSRVQTLVNIANSLGMDHIHLGTPLQDKIKGQGVKFNSGHNDHIHIGTEMEKRIRKIIVFLISPNDSFLYKESR